MKCTRCGSDNVTINMVQVKSKTRKKDMGCLWSIMRGLLILCTCGLWLLIGRRSGTEKTKIKSEKQAICQACGNSWTIK